MALRSRLRDIPLPNQPIHEILIAELEKHGETVALIDADRPSRRYTSADVVRTARLLAAALHRWRLTKGDVVSIVLPNCIHYPVVQLAVWLCGGVCSTVNHLYTEYELTHHFQGTNPKLVFTTAEAVHKVRTVDRQLGGGIQHIIIVETSATDDAVASVEDGVVKFRDLLTAAKDAHWPLPPRVAIDPKKDLALLPYSSGTTGPPKAVMLSHYAVSSGLHVFKDERNLLLPQKGETVPMFLPMFHLLGFIVDYTLLRLGVALVVMERYNQDKFLKAIQQHQTRHIYAVPPTLVALAKDPSVAKHDISCLQSIFVGGAPIGQDISRGLFERHPNIQYLMQGYGMTEIGVSHVMPPTTKRLLKHGSCGRLAANFECKVVDVVTQQQLGVDERGELWIRGPATMLGYRNRKDATFATIDRDGWVHTGDIGYYDSDGDFFIADRLKELIKVKGFQVAPAELEDVLLSHIGVQDTAVIGVPDELAGELPRAYIVRKATVDGQRLSEQEIHRFVNEKVAPYKRLKGGIEFVEQIAKSPSGKLLRRILKDKYEMSQKRSKL